MTTPPSVRLVHDAEDGAVRVLPIGDGVPVPSDLRRSAEAANFTGRMGEATESFPASGRAMLLGIGNQSDANGRQAGAQAAARLLSCESVAIDARGLAPSLASALAEGAVMRAWRPPQRRKNSNPDAGKLSRIDLVVDDLEVARPAWDYVAAGVAGAAFARDLVAEPSNTLTPAAFASRLDVLRDEGVVVEVLKPRALQAEGFGLLLAVGQASAHRPRVAVLRWPGASDAAPIVFVGKGITFDTGGLSIKPADRLWEMRADMAGAAACVGAILAIARRRSPTPAIAVLPLAENAIGANGYRPGDVLRGVDGRTVEVVDTDAEGRLVLADALAYAVRRFAPRALITIATLTGAIVTALGHHRAGLFSNAPALADALVAAAEAVDEPVWKMPIGKAHRKDIDSDIADLRHCLPGRFQPDACHAAAFLREFADGAPWAHLDIAGVEGREAASDAHAAGATGFGARLLAALPERFA